MKNELERDLACGKDHGAVVCKLDPFLILKPIVLTWVDEGA